ncbi:MAG: BCAM0308 family protein [Armatimonadota bacterium]|nr:BCAM0308 family protein [Armatimonadota bacterium]
MHIRRNVEDFDDPYIPEEHLPEGTKCNLCGSIWHENHWHLPDDYQLPIRRPGQQNETPSHGSLCPACRKIQDHVPGGVLRLSGSFVFDHEEEILNLIRNETIKAMGLNPLERIMSLEFDDGGIEITTTNEKLAQRIGKALHKAYSGSIEYKWSEDTKLARVHWHRDV